MCVHTLSHVSYNFIPSPVSCSQSNRLYTDVYWEKYELFFLFPINNILGFFYLINFKKNRILRKIGFILSLTFLPDLIRILKEIIS